jgi:hypothetical protein
MRAPFDSIGGSLWPHLLLPAVQIFGLALPPFKGRAAVLIPTICALVYATWTNLFPENVVGRGFLVAQWPVRNPLYAYSMAFRTDAL